jgi:F0F1-type ATP synthase epsilon subunit
MIELNTPAGKILISPNRIESISEIKPRKGENNTVVNTQIYCVAGGEAYNILEYYEEVRKKMGF